MTKTALKDRCKVILNSLNLGDSIDSSSDDYRFLLRIFQGHPEYSIKSGSGIAGVYIQKDTVHNTRCFHIKRLDGSSSDISYIRSIDGATSMVSDIKCACRSSIRNIVIGFRQTVRFGVDVCPITGELLMSDNTHVDHYNKTFDQIATDWIKQYPINFLHGLLNDTSKDNETEIFFTNSDIRKSFIEYHNANTHLRAVSKKANLSTLKRRAVR